MNLNTTRVCNLPSYPGVDGFGPVVMTYLEGQQRLAACGSFADSDQSCYQLSPDDQPPVWQPLAAGQLINHHCPTPDSTRNHFLSEIGWFLVGQEDGRCGIDGAAILTELLTPDLQWVSLPILSPFSSLAGYPALTCSVDIDSSGTVIVTGGYNGIGDLAYTHKLDLTDYQWTHCKDMPGPRFGHGCTATAAGEVIIAGGFDRYDHLVSSVYVYNLVSDTWSQAGDLPNGMNYDYPVMFLWNKHPIILENFSSNIWILGDGANWQKMEASMGGYFDGLSDTATTVPSGIFSC